MNPSLFWIVYMLLCDGKSFYVGITNDIVNRLKEHENKKSLHTKRFSTFKLVYAEKYIIKHDAAKREKQFKGWRHTKKQLLVDGKLGINICTELVEGLLRDGAL